MKVTRYTHLRTTYLFSPPIEVGERTEVTLPELVALALQGPTLPQNVIDMMAEQAAKALEVAHDSGTVLLVLRELLGGKYEVAFA